MLLPLPSDRDLLSKLLNEIDELDGMLARMVATAEEAVEAAGLIPHLVPQVYVMTPEEQLDLIKRLEGNFDESVQSFRSLQMASVAKLSPLRYLSLEEATDCLRVYKRIENASEAQLGHCQSAVERLCRAGETGEQGDALQVAWELAIGMLRIRNPMGRNLRSVLARLRGRVVAAIASTSTTVTQAGESSPGVKATVTLDQAAAHVNRSKHTLRKYKDLPPQVNPNKKRGQPAEYYWDDMKPFLDRHFPRVLPDLPLSAHRLLG